MLLLQKTAQFKATSLPGKKAYYRTDESPDVWFEPTEVWEIRGADLTVSPVHKAAVGHIHPDRGISLRSAPVKVLFSQASGFAGLLSGLLWVQRLPDGLDSTFLLFLCRLGVRACSTYCTHHIWQSAVRLS